MLRTAVQIILTSILAMSINRSTQPTLDALSGRYHSYLVRLWQSHPQAPLRASAQDVQTGETRRFADLASLFAFLQTQGDREFSTPATHPAPTSNID